MFFVNASFLGSADSIMVTPTNVDNITYTQYMMRSWLQMMLILTNQMNLLFRENGIVTQSFIPVS